MQASKHLLYGLVIILLLAGCDKKEKPFKLPPPGNTNHLAVAMGENYDSVIYVSLATGATHTYTLNAWDLAFENTPSGYGIFMNGGNEVLISKTKYTNWEQTISPDNLEWQWDNPCGDPDSTALGRWIDSTGFIYIVDLGKNVSDRYKKLRLVSVNPDMYTIQYADMDGNTVKTVNILKTGTSTLLYFSFKTGANLSCEPSSADWDIVFTRYRHVYYDMNPVTSYYVTGALINPGRLSAAKLTSPPFSTISKQDALAAGFSNKKNSVGFDWKHYDMTTGTYMTNPDISYLLKDDKGNVYKLHFTDFYSKTGVKGSPNFEYQLL